LSSSTLGFREWGATGTTRSAELSLTAQQAELVATNRAHQKTATVLLSFLLGLKHVQVFLSEVAGDRLEMRSAGPVSPSRR